MSVLTLEEVEALARRAHAGQTDKAGIPYVEHVAAVAHGVRERGGDEQIAAAWLHDAVEDGVVPDGWLATAPLTPHTKRQGEPLEAYAARLRATGRRAHQGGRRGPQRGPGLTGPARPRDPGAAEREVRPHPTTPRAAGQ